MDLMKLIEIFIIIIFAIRGSIGFSEDVLKRIKSKEKNENIYWSFNRNNFRNRVLVSNNNFNYSIHNIKLIKQKAGKELKNEIQYNHKGEKERKWKKNIQ